MALNSSITTPIIARKFGRTLERIEHLSDACLKYQEFGKVGVSCQFRLSKSKWGVLGDAENPAGIIYMSLGFDQPKDCKLSNATVSITLEENDWGEAGGKRTANKSFSNSLHITDRYGPKQLSGPERKFSVTRNIHMTPNINVIGNGAGGVGLDTTKEVVLSSRWIFDGRLKPAVHPTQKGRHTAVYRTLEWELTESDFEPQAAHSNMIHTAFAFEHEGKPFYMEVNVKGKLKSTKNKILRHLRFSSDQDKSRGSTSTFVHLPRGNRNSARLDALADRLPESMKMENLQEVRTEVPDALPASILMGDIKGAAPGEGFDAPNFAFAPSTESRPPTLIASSTERVTVPSIPMDSRVSNIALTDPTYPSIENLSRVHLVLANPLQDGSQTSEQLPKNTTLTTSDPAADPQDGSQSENGSSWFRSESTLVDERDAEQVDDTKLAKHKDIQDSLLLLSQSPYFLVLLRLIIGLMMMFGKKQKPLENPPCSGEDINNIKEDGKLNQNEVTQFLRGGN
ncbi:hypothetical protein SBOR_6053 [Sclerotinia borealis F-4128]|uniref:Uncharacterized protein n=1 Tax=Sclerotinia borealis (strain F-4128) TaxID=1432307 RepID=W9CG89_SCLBF|nr:hypothetical protein SBOR_6053 [Sclerotinia borealis F-4128]